MGALQSQHFGGLEDEGEACREPGALRADNLAVQASLVQLDNEYTALRLRLAASQDAGAAAKEEVARLEGELAAQARERDFFIDNILVRTHLDFSGPVLRHGRLNSLFQVALYLPS